MFFVWSCNVLASLSRGGGRVPLPFLLLMSWFRHKCDVVSLFQEMLERQDKSEPKDGVVEKGTSRRKNVVIVDEQPQRQSGGGCCGGGS